MKNAANAELRAFSDSGYVDKKLALQRRKLLDAFLEFKGHSTKETILDIGVTSTGQLASGSRLQTWVAAAEQPFVKSCSIAVSANGPWRCAQPDAAAPGEQGAQALPFADNQFDWIFCSEVLEHAGPHAHQLNLLRELNRIARKGVFVATENRRHPIEFHTGLPLLHWLPGSLWRGSLRLLGKGQWASETLLNPVGSDALKNMAATLPGLASSDIGHLRVAGVKAHFFLMLRKKETA